MLHSELKYKKNGDRELVILRGVAGSGKSSFIKENNLEGYTLSMDDIRMMVTSPTTDEDGFKTVSMERNREVATIFNDMLERRMKNGAFTVIDNMNLNLEYIKGYSMLCDKYGYTITIVDFDVTYEELCRRNEKRYGTLKYFRNEDKFKTVYDTYIQNKKAVERKYKVVDSKSEDAKELFRDRYTNIDKYKKVKVIGDIHGCYDVLKTALPTIKEDVFYIFLGDYIDRGTKNHEVLNFLSKIYDKENVVLLEGNHEIHLRAYLNNYDLGYGKEFKGYTIKELKSKNTDFKKARKVINSLRTSYLFSYKGRRYVCTHGGILPCEVKLLTHDEKIKGIGGYDFNVDEKWDTLTDGVTQFHGHRNKLNIPKDRYKYSYNLEDGVDSGGNLRIATIKGDKVTVKEYQNNIVRKDRGSIKKERDKLKDYLTKVDSTEGVYRQNIDLRGLSIDSIKFGCKYLFREKISSEPLKTVSELFISKGNSKTDYKVIMRGYDSIYNIEDATDELQDELLDILTFPINVYKKGNGYLGLVSYSIELDDFLFSTKSLIADSIVDTREDVNKLRELFYKTFEGRLGKVKDYLNLNNRTLTFEVTKSKEDKLVMMDAIRNTIDFNKASYKELSKLSKSLGVKVKKKVVTIKSKEELDSFLSNILDKLSGVVLEDSKEIMCYLNSNVFYDSMKDFMVECYSVNKSEAEEMVGKYKDEINISYNIVQHLGPDYFAIQILMNEGVIPYKPI